MRTAREYRRAARGPTAVRRDGRALRPCRSTSTSNTHAIRCARPRGTESGSRCDPSPHGRARRSRRPLTGQGRRASVGRNRVSASNQGRGHGHWPSLATRNAAGSSSLGPVTRTADIQAAAFHGQGGAAHFAGSVMVARAGLRWGQWARRCRWREVPRAHATLPAQPQPAPRMTPTPAPPAHRERGWSGPQRAPRAHVPGRWSKIELRAL